MWPFKKTVHVESLVKEYVGNVKDYDDTFLIPKKIFLPLALRLMRKDGPRVKLFCELVYWFESLSLLIALVLDFVKLKLLMSSADLDATIIFRMLPCMGYLHLAMLKTHKIVQHRSVFENLVDELRSMWPQGEITEEEYTIINKALKKTNFFVQAYYYCNYALALSIAIPPYVEVVMRSLGRDIPRILPFDYWTPEGTTNPGWFEFMLTVQIWQTLLTIWFIVVGDLLFCIFLNHITIQFDLLCVRIKKLFYVPVDTQLPAEYPLGEYDQEMLEADRVYLRSLNAAENNNKHQMELTEIVKRHNALIRLAGDMENMFSLAMFFNFFYSSIIICFCGFCSLLIEKWNEFMYKSFLMSALAQTWLLCWYGQQLLESSTRVSDALYECGWYTASRGIGKSILIMMHRSQKSVYITTYGFSIICLASYTTIIKTAWSYFTLLLKTYEV